MRLRFLNFANMLFQSLAKKKPQKTKNKTQYVISPYFSFETKFNLPPLYPLNHDVLSHIVIHFLFHSVTFELSQMDQLLSAISEHLCPGLLFLVLHVGFLPDKIR